MILPKDGEVELVHAFTKGAYVQHSLEYGVPFFFNPYRMASTLEWLQTPPDVVAAAYLASLCRDHNREFEEVEQRTLLNAHLTPFSRCFNAIFTLI